MVCPMAIAFVIAGVGIALTSDSLTRIAIAAAHSGSSEAVALIGTARQVGGAIGISVMGLVVQTGATSSHGSRQHFEASYAGAVSSAMVVASWVVMAGAVVVAALAGSIGRAAR